MDSSPRTFNLAACNAELRGFAVHRLDFDRHTRAACVHQCATLLFAEEGEGQWQAGSESLTLRKGQVGLLPQGERHIYQDCDELQGWVVHVTPQAITSASGPSPLFSPLDRVRLGFQHVQGVERAMTRLQQRLATIHTELAEERWCYEEAAQAELTLLLVELGREFLPTQKLQAPQQPGRVGEALAMIEARYREPISLSEIAAELKCNPAHLTTLVRRATGMTVVQWILAFRMADARRRLEGTDEQVEIISERVGFQSPEHFSRLFKREHGLAPGRWRMDKRFVSLLQRSSIE